MESKESTGRKPDYTGNGVAVWLWEKGTEKERLSIKIIGHDYITAWVYKDKEGVQ